MVTPELARILEALEIVVVSDSKRIGPGETRAVATMQDILNRLGEKHLIFVLRSIAESTNNKRALYSHVILAMSDIVLAHEKWAEDTETWFETLDRISLEDLEAASRLNRKAVKKRKAIAAYLFERLYPVFEAKRQLRIRGT